MSDVKDIPVGVSSSGSRYYYQVKYKYDEESKCHVPYFDKPLNMFEMIQASKSSVDINTIVKRAQVGDLAVLHLGEKPYGDVSNIPDNLNDLNEMNLQAVNQFISLDPSIRILFDNDVNKFSKAIEDGTYIDTINKAFAPKKEQKVEDKKDGE